MDLIKIDKFGFWFMHAKGTPLEDEVGWIWWWLRKKNNRKKFYSVGFDCGVESLGELDTMWRGYFKACKGQTKGKHCRLRENNKND